MSVRIFKVSASQRAEQTRIPRLLHRSLGVVVLFFEGKTLCLPPHPCPPWNHSQDATKKICMPPQITYQRNLRVPYHPGNEMISYCRKTHRVTSPRRRQWAASVVALARARKQVVLSHTLYCRFPSLLGVRPRCTWRAEPASDCVEASATAALA